MSCNEDLHGLGNPMRRKSNGQAVGGMVVVEWYNNIYKKKFNAPWGVWLWLVVTFWHEPEEHSTNDDRANSCRAVYTIFISFLLVYRICFSPCGKNVGRRTGKKLFCFKMNMLNTNIIINSPSYYLYDILVSIITPHKQQQKK